MQLFEEKLKNSQPEEERNFCRSGDGEWDAPEWKQSCQIPPETSINDSTAEKKTLFLWALKFCVKVEQRPVSCVQTDERQQPSGPSGGGACGCRIEISSSITVSFSRLQHFITSAEPTPRGWEVRYVCDEFPVDSICAAAAAACLLLRWN